MNKQLAKKPPKRVHMASSVMKQRINVGLPNRRFSWGSMAATCVAGECVDVYRNMKVVSRPSRRVIEGRQSPLTLISKADSEIQPKQGIYIDVDE
jgi:hypothetical protein